MNWVTEHTNIIERIEERLDKLEQDSNNLGSLVAAINKFIDSQEKIIKSLERIDNTIYDLKRTMEELHHD